MIIPETTIPIYPSKLKCKTGDNNVDTRTAIVPHTSLIESNADASNKLESYVLESFLLYVYIQNLTMIETKRIMTDANLKSILPG